MKSQVTQLGMEFKPSSACLHAHSYHFTAKAIHGRGAGDHCEYLPWRSKREREKEVGSHFTDGQTEPTEGNQLAHSQRASW